MPKSQRHKQLRRATRIAIMETAAFVLILAFVSSVASADLHFMDVVSIRDPLDHAGASKTHFHNIISSALTQEDASPFLWLDYFNENFEAQPNNLPCTKKESRGFSTHHLENGEHSINYVRKVNGDGTEGIGFHFGLDDPTNSETFSRLGEVPTSPFTDGVNARVLVGKAFGVDGFHPSTLRIHIVDFELDPFSYFTVEVPDDIEVVFAFVYDGTITRINEDPEWIGSQHLIVMDGSSPYHRGMSFETQGEGCKFLLLAGSKTVDHGNANAAFTRNIRSGEFINETPELTLVGNVFTGPSRGQDESENDEKPGCDFKDEQVAQEN